MELSDDYIKNKELFFNYNNYKDSSIKPYMALYKKYVYNKEIVFNKDLMLFNRKQIQEIAEQVIGLNKSTASMLKSFIKKYGEWGEKNKLEVGYYIEEKDFKVIDFYEWFINLDDFYEMCEEMLSLVDIPIIMPLILARYGVTGDELIDMRNLKWDDIDRKHRKIVIDKNGEVLKFKIDKVFISWIDRAKEYAKANKLDYGNIITPTDNVKTLKNKKVINYNTVYTRANTAFSKVGRKRIPYKDLASSRMLDILHEEKGSYITLKDIKWIMKEFGEDPKTNNSKIYKLQSAYESLKNKIDTDLNMLRANKVIARKLIIKKPPKNKITDVFEEVENTNMIDTDTSLENPSWLVKELWRDVPDYEGLYELSNFGHIRFVNEYEIKFKNNQKSKKRLTPKYGIDGSVKVYLTKNNWSEYESFDRLVYKAFYPEFDMNDNRIVIKHRDGDIQNCGIENLYALTKI
jgi:integrase